MHRHLFQAPVSALLIFATLLVAIETSAKTTIQCSTFQEQSQKLKIPQLAKLPGGYCISTQDTSKNPDVLWYLHGLGNDQHAWNDPYSYTSQIQTLWEQRHVDQPTVIAISFGPAWLLSDFFKERPQTSGLFPIVRDQIIPMLEKMIGGVKGRRLLLGESMGGVNGLQLSLRTPLFERAAILCAPISATLTPFSTQAQIDAVVTSSNASHYYGSDLSPIYTALGTALKTSGAVFPDLAAWQTFDPFVLATKVDVGSLPKLYMSAGYYDQYLSFDADQELARRLREVGAQVQWRPEWGQHCTVDIPSLASFLVE